MDTIKPSPEGKGRKKVANPAKWKRNLEKAFRHSTKSPEVPRCPHIDLKSFQCLELNMGDIQEFNRLFYETSVKVLQDSFILKHISVKPRKRNRQVKEGASRKKFSIAYFLKPKTGDVKRVCQDTFLRVLCITKARVHVIAKKYFEGCSVPHDRRGGDRVSSRFSDKRQCVKSFIESLKCTESHYCRGKSSRQYLPCGLNIAGLLKTYNEKCVLEGKEDMKVKRTFFRNIFCREYNVGFGAPVTDECSTCVELKERSKYGTDGEKQTLMVQLNIHKLRANAFFAILKEAEPNELVLSFDCQKNLVNPKVQDQIAYYSRQIYTYNFTVVQGTSHSKLNKDSVFTYTWMENEYAKGSNEISSAVCHRILSSNLSEYTKIRLHADGCGGQNRNSTLVAMLIHILQNKLPKQIEEIEIVFPVTGHSFLPSDRVFGRIEQRLKKIPVIIDPEDYIKVFSEHGTVIKLEDVDVRDWKEAAKCGLKATGYWHFQFNKTKRFVITKTKKKGVVLVRGEQFYRNNLGTAKSLMKKGKKFVPYPAMIKKGVPVKPLKLRDVQNLLVKHFGEEWQKIPQVPDFYKELLVSGVGPQEAGHENGAGGFCESQEDFSIEMEMEMFL